VWEEKEDESKRKQLEKPKGRTNEKIQGAKGGKGGQRRSGRTKT
jgi:hypothetical protein